LICGIKAHVNGLTMSECSPENLQTFHRDGPVD
jgi:hypothetical protein